MRINSFKPYITGKEIEYIQDIISKRRDMSGDGLYTKRVHRFLEKGYKVPKVLLTTSGTTALEFAVRLLDLKPGDEVIVPSFTFSSTANAVLLISGAKVVFAEIQKDTLNIDPEDIAQKITKRTKAIIVVHYAGVACEMDKIMELAKKHHLKVIEDAAQGIESKYKDRFLGTIGDFGCLSFHDTKNITCGEGGALFINTKDKDVIEQAEIIREKGTNRSKFFRGEIDKYTWVDIGSSYLPSDILAAFLFAQLEQVKSITRKRLEIYDYYRKNLLPYEQRGFLKLPTIPSYATHNAHIFYVVFNSENERNRIMRFLKKNGIQATFHYVPLHSSPQGEKLGYQEKDFPITENVSRCLLRLPIYADMSKRNVQYVIKIFDQAIKGIYEK